MSDAGITRQTIDAELATTMWQNGFDIYVNDALLPPYDKNVYENNHITYDVIRDAHDESGKSWITAAPADIQQETDIDKLSDALHDLISHLESSESEYRLDEYGHNLYEYSWNKGWTAYQNVEAALAAGKVGFIQSFLEDIAADSEISSKYGNFDGSEYRLPNFADINELIGAVNNYKEKYGVESPEYFIVSINTTNMDELNEIVRDFKSSGYQVLWDKDHKSLVTTIDDIDDVRNTLYNNDVSFSFDVLPKAKFSELIEQNALLSPDHIHEISKDLARAVFEDGIDVYANGVRMDVYAYTTDVQENNVWNRLWAHDATLSVNESDYGKVSLANEIASAVVCISTAAKSFGDYLPAYAAHANEETPFEYRRERSEYRNIIDACLNDNVYFIQEWLDDVARENPSLTRVSDYENTGIASISKLRQDIKTYIDNYIFEPEPKTDITIKCELSESYSFEDGKTYTVAEFDKIMAEAEEAKQAARNAVIDKYGNKENALNVLNNEEYGSETYREIGSAMRYDKTKFTIEFPNGNTITERQDIGDGFKGVIEYMKSFKTSYGGVVEALEEQVKKDAMNWLIEQQKADFYEPHIYVQNNDAEIRRYELCPIYFDSSRLNESSAFDTVDEARKIGQKYLQNGLDPHSLAPSDKRIEGYAIYDVAKKRIVETCGVTDYELTKSFPKEVIHNTMSAESLEKHKSVRAEME